MNGSKNRPSFSVKILLFFLTSGYLIFSPVVFGIGLSQEQTGFTGYDSPIQETSGLEATNYETKDYSTIFGQDLSLQIKVQACHILKNLLWNLKIAYQKALQHSLINLNNTLQFMKKAHQKSQDLYQKERTLSLVN